MHSAIYDTSSAGNPPAERAMHLRHEAARLAGEPALTALGSAGRNLALLTDVAEHAARLRDPSAAPWQHQDAALRLDLALAAAGFMCWDEVARRHPAPGVSC